MDKSNKIQTRVQVFKSIMSCCPKGTHWIGDLMYLSVLDLESRHSRVSLFWLRVFLLVTVNWAGGS